MTTIAITVLFLKNTAQNNNYARDSTFQLCAHSIPIYMCDDLLLKIRNYFPSFVDN